jgi:predicted ArsR family transcriptional regulator
MSANALASVLNCTYEHVRRVCVGMFQQGELIRTKVKGGGLGRPNYMYSIE